MARAKDFANNGANKVRTDFTELEKAAGRMWGGIPGVERGALPDEERDALRASKKERLLPVDIFEVAPDPLQPRRAMPHFVRGAWRFDLTADGMARLFGVWSQAASDELGSDVWPSLEALVMGTDADTNESEGAELPPITANLLKLAGLAGDLRANGQTNPITVYKTAQGYKIETGERRWLAFHLLNIFDENNYRKIAAREVQGFSVWRQAGENSVRSELNAIAKARQLALLLMDLHGADNFAPMTDFAHEQQFYAQVSDGNQWRVPRGAGEKLLNAMGLTNTVQLRQYRSLLRLPVDVWEQADDENWAELRIRHYMAGDTVTTVTVSDESPNVLVVDAMQELAGVADEPVDARDETPLVQLTMFKPLDFKAMARVQNAAQKGIPDDPHYRRTLARDAKRVIEMAQQLLKMLGGSE